MANVFVPFTVYYHEYDVIPGVYSTMELAIVALAADCVSRDGSISNGMEGGVWEFEVDGERVSTREFSNAELRAAARPSAATRGKTP